VTQVAPRRAQLGSLRAIGRKPTKDLPMIDASWLVFVVALGVRLAFERR
jgi:hypothetical protein